MEYVMMFFTVYGAVCFFGMIFFVVSYLVFLFKDEKQDPVEEVKQILNKVNHE